MEKEERAGSGPGLQGLFRAPVVSDLDREVPRVSSHSPVAAGILAQLKRPLNAFFSPKKPWVLLFHSLVCFC